MWRKGWFLSATFLLLLLAASTSCKKKNPTTGTVEGTEVLESGGIDTFTLYTSTFYDDSVQTSGRFYGILGSCEDPVFGRVNSEIYTQFRLLYEGPTFDDPAQITIDSVVLAFVYEGMYGTPGNQTVEVYEIGGTEPLSDTVTYYTFSTLPETGSNLVAPGSEVQYLDPDHVTYIDTVLVDPQLRIQLDTNLGWQLINEAYYNPTSFESNDAFTDYFKGLKIKTNNGSQASGDGGLFYFNLEDTDSKLTIYYKSAGETRTFDLLINSSAPWFNHIDLNTSAAVQSVIDNPSLGQVQFYTQSCHSRALVKIPGLDNLPPNVIVHSATLELPVQYQSGQPFEPGLDVSVALFTSSTDSTLISDLQTYGLYDVSGKKFTVDMRNYVQHIVSGEFENTGFVITPLGFSNTSDRIVFNGPETTNKEKPRFKIVYTEF